MKYKIKIQIGDEVVEGSGNCKKKDVIKELHKAVSTMETLLESQV